MKKIIYIFIIMSTFLFSCNDDFLDRKPYDALSSSNIWTSDANAKMAVNGIYNALNRTNAFGGYFLNFSNLGPDGTTHNGGSIQMGNSTSRDGLYRNVYTDLYRVIAYANDAIVNLEGNEAITDDLASQMIGEAKFMRGLAYFYLWQLYGGVIILKEPVLPSETYLPRNSAQEVKELVISDFTDAVSKLPVSYSGADIGRVTKGAAIAMLGKTYLFDEQWDMAVTELSKLMTSPFNYELHPDYYQLFDFKWENNPEVVFALQQVMEPNLGSDYDMRYGGRSTNTAAWNNGTASYLAVSNYTHTDGSPIDMSAMPQREDYASEFEYGLALIPWYQETFAEESVDERVHGNVIMPGFTFIGNNNEEFIVNWPYSEHANDEPYRAYRTNWTGTAIFPWRKLVNVGEENTQRWDSPNDLPFIRFADVLLMYAEASNEASGVSPEVYNAVNTVRNRAGVANLPEGLDKDQMRTAIRRERIKEFAGEGHPFFDVRRWRTAATDNPIFGLNHDVLDFRGMKLYTRKFEEKDYLWPIPEQEREINTNLEQNPGWES